MVAIETSVRNDVFVFLLVMLVACADWPSGKPGDFPVGPGFRKFIGPPHRLFNMDIVIFRGKMTSTM